MQAIKDRGLIARTEVGFDVGAGGFKTRRFADVVAVDPVTGEILEVHQVGRQTTAGRPVWREVHPIIPPRRPGVDR